MPQKFIPLGKDNFKELMEDDCYYVDKTLLIKELLNNKSKVVLFTRPRRFGKTLNLSMLKCFFEKPEGRKIEANIGIEEAKDYSYLFAGLNIAKESEAMLHQGQYPVVNFSFKKVKAEEFAQAYENLKKEISKEYIKHKYILDVVSLEEFEREKYFNIINLKASESDYTDAIKDLCKYLYWYYQKSVYVLIDEYDTPLHYAKLNGYYREMINIMRTLMVDGMKDNAAMKQAIITGIMKIAGESIFSSFNNPKTTTISESFCDDQFGFLEEEVLQLLKYFGFEARFEEVKGWYNGYQFGEKIIYNQWSILNFIDNKGIFKPYWVNTGDTDLIKKSLQLDITQSKKNLEILLRGERIKVEIDQNIVYEDVLNDVSKSYSFLYHAGYLKGSWIESTKYYVEIPNYEVAEVFKGMLKNWLNQDLFKQGDLVKNFIESMLNKDEAIFNIKLNRILLNSASYYDTNVKGANETKEEQEETKYENFYHGIILGIMLNLEEDYQVESNKEYGLGKPDIVVIPRDSSKEGYILEFKRARKKERIGLTALTKAAHKQIIEKKYEAGLDKKALSWVKIGIGCKGKECRAVMVLGN